MGTTHIRIKEDKKEELMNVKNRISMLSGEEITMSEMLDRIEADDLERLLTEEETKMRNTRSIFE